MTHYRSACQDDKWKNPRYNWDNRTVTCHQRFFLDCSSGNPYWKVELVKQPQTLIELAELAVTKRQASGRRLAELAQNEGFALASTTFNHIRAGRYKSTPTDETIRAIGWLAGVSDEVAFAAAGQKAPGLPLADELPPGADNLSAKARKTIIDLTRVLIEYEAGSNEQDQQPNEPIEPLRAVAPTSNSGTGQKTELPDSPEEAIAKLRLKKAQATEGSEGFGITEIHGAEAEKYPAPPIEQLAAHPKVKTRRELLEDETGEHGDETRGF